MPTHNFPEYNKVVEVDILDMAKDYPGVTPLEIHLPNGSKFMGTAWDKSAIQQGVIDVQKIVGDADCIVFNGRVNSYVMGSQAHPCYPRHCCQYIPPHGPNADIGGPGMYEHFELLERGEFNPEGHILFDVKEKGDYVYIELTVQDGTDFGHAYQMSDLPKVKLPEIPAGKHVLLHGKTMTSVVISVAEGYADIAKSMSLLYGNETSYVCIWSNDPNLEIGDRYPA